MLNHPSAAIPTLHAAATRTPFPPSLVFEDVEAHLLAMEALGEPAEGVSEAWQAHMARTLGQPMPGALAG